MSITVQLDPDVEARLVARARAEGVPLDAYLKTVIEQIANADDLRAVSPAEFEAGLDALAAGSEQLPVLPPEAYRREQIYGEP